MNKLYLKYTSIFLAIHLLGSTGIIAQDLSIDNQFIKTNASKKWKKVFKDKGKKKWTKKWFLDGKIATVENTRKGMNFSAGPEDQNDAHHAVLWTNQNFEGELKIKYDYTITDTANGKVNILYIQATGLGKPPFENDISKWNQLRETPSMRTYFKNMNTLHISYAAYGSGSQYVRARRYPVNTETTFKQMQIDPSYDNIGDLFQKNITYHITVIKTKKTLFFKVEGNNTNKTFSWDLTQKKPILEGRIGLRHMYTRSARYKNFTVYTSK